VLLLASPKSTYRSRRDRTKNTGKRLEKRWLLGWPGKAEGLSDSLVGTEEI